ncbi:tRNA pseudouridine(38-40) synthase TruA [Rubripirellula sp.]|nr:tRNA pseudouridine(38-40) synthase TruA [Rubripirellula sp.]MDB4338583.1 tRNA pseudouridine(38-40) synthase TruA [Rubripirellula sp.]
MQRTFKLTIAYEGTRYSGWQVQPGEATIQGALQEALSAVSNEPVSVIGSGRTDAGVHAIGQVVSCRLNFSGDPERLSLALNTKLPEDIVVRDSKVIQDDFHAIRDAARKRYRYQLQVGGVSSPFQRRYRWRLRKSISVNRMCEAAKYIVGEKDFASFQATGAERKTTIRTVYACDVFEQSYLESSEGVSVAIEIEANGFLYNMVRNIVGSLVEVGSGKQKPEWIQSILDAKDRSIAGPTAPPHGLFLLRVDYPDH